jgi:hypothetical protein
MKPESKALILVFIVAIGSYALIWEILSITGRSVTIPFWLEVLGASIIPVTAILRFAIPELNDRYHFYGKKDVPKEEENKFAT